MPKSLNMTRLRPALSPIKTLKDNGKKFIGHGQLRHTSKGFYQSPRWRAVRAVARKILGDTCARCGSTEHTLVDHIRGVEEGGNPWSTELQVLCNTCNQQLAAMDKRKARGDKTLYQRDYRTPEQRQALVTLAQSSKWQRIMKLSPEGAGGSRQALAGWSGKV